MSEKVVALSERRIAKQYEKNNNLNINVAYDDVHTIAPKLNPKEIRKQMIKGYMELTSKMLNK